MIYGRGTMFTRTTLVSVLLVLASVSVWASIEKEPPVKVTHKNSGPKYDMVDVEKIKLESQDSNSDNLLSFRNPFVSAGGEQPPQSQPDATGDVAPAIGRVSIRRIFLVPMHAPQTDGSNMWSQGPSTATGERSESQSEDQLPRFFARPSWPFMAPARHHLFGGDEASRSPTAESSVERPSQVDRPMAEAAGEREEPERPRIMIDPIQMMIDLMQHALNPQSSSGTSLFKDLNKEASGTAADGENKPSGGESEGGFDRPIVPMMRNETKEDVVEIDGKKFLRKTVINRHVGENIVFMTKRLIFVPLNETTTNNEEPSTTTTTPVVPSTTNSIATEGSVPNQTSSPQESIISGSSEPKIEEAISSSTTTTSAPTTSVASEASSTTTSDASTTTTTIPSTTAGEIAANAAEEPRV